MTVRIKPALSTCLLGGLLTASLVAQPPDAATTWFLRGEADASHRQYRAAVKDYDQAIQRRPGLVDAWCHRGEMYRLQHHPERAIQDLDHAILLDPQRAEAYFSRANCRTDLQQYYAALDDLAMSIKLQPNDYRSYYNRGNLYQQLQDYDRAIQDYTQAIKLNPHVPAVWQNRGATWFLLLRPDKTLEDVNQAIHLNPAKASYYLSRGMAHDALGAHADAVDDYGHAIRLQPDYAQAWFKRGEARRALGQPAQSDFDRAMQLDPTLKTEFRGLPQLVNLLQDVVLKGEPWTFEGWTARVAEEQLSARAGLIDTASEWRVPDGLKAKVSDTGDLFPFFGDTTVFPLSPVEQQALGGAQERLLATVGDVLARPLDADHFHLTLHDLSNGARPPATLESNETHCRQIFRDLHQHLAAHPEDAAIELVSTRAFTSVNVSVVMGFTPRTDRDFRILMNTYNRFDEVVYLSYWLRPHVTLAYLKPHPLSPDRRTRLSNTLSTLSTPIPLSLNLRSLTYQHFLDMNHYRTLLSVQSTQL